MARMIESGPIPAVHGVVRWRLIDLSQWIYEEFRITVAKQTLSRELRAMGYRKLSARPRHHAQAEGAISGTKHLGRIPSFLSVLAAQPVRSKPSMNAHGCQYHSKSRLRSELNLIY